MGMGLSRFKNKFKKNQPEPLQVIPREVSEIKSEVEEQMHEYCHIFEPQIGRSGISFYTSIDENGDPKKSNYLKPTLSSESRGDCLSDAFTAKEREIMAGIIVEENLRKKAHVAHVSEYRRQLLLRRRERQVEERKEKFEDKMRRNEVRKNELQRRLRPLNPELKTVYQRTNIFREARMYPTQTNNHVSLI